jgi:tetratricopeptide (TPR) repeat protein
MRRISPFLILFTAVGISSGPSIRNDLVWDDRLFVSGNPIVREARWDEIATRRIGSYYRPVVFATFALEAQVAGDAPALFHATNLLLHAIAASLLYTAALALGAGRGAALAGSLLFALHPVQSEAVFYVSGRTDLLAAGFALAALLLHARAGRWCQDTVGRWTSIGAASFFALALACKESVAVMPLALACGDRMLAPEASRSLRAILRRSLPYVLVLAAHAAWRASLAGEGLVLSGPRDGLRLAAAAAAFADYLGLLLLPTGLHLERFASDEAAWRVAIGLLGLALLVASAYRARPAIRFWLTWAGCAYLPTSNLIPVYPGLPEGRVFAPEHFLYLPSTGLLLAFSLAVAPRLPARVAAAGLVVALLAYTAILHDRARDWRDAETLYTQTLEHSPGSARVRLNLGNLLLERGETERALAEFAAGLAVAPRDPDLLTNAGVAAMRLGRFVDAERALQQVVELEPDRSQAWSNLAALYGMAGRLGEARRTYQRALERDARNPDALAGLRMLDALERPSGPGDP